MSVAAPALQLVTPTLAELLGEAKAFLRHYVVLADAQSDTLALYVAHTHAIEAFDVTPYVVITSALKRSGKSRLLDLLQLLVREPIKTANISEAALFRLVAQKTPTLLIDEADMIFAQREKQGLQGLLNAGFERGAHTYRIGGRNMATLEEFPVFSPKVFAGIGDCLPDTIMDRAITIRLERRTRDERIERFRRREVRPEAEQVREALAASLVGCEEQIRRAPLLPAELDDRAQDIWEPLVQVAELVGEGWPGRARRAALELSIGSLREDTSPSGRLIADIYQLFRSGAIEDRVQSAELIAHLARIEESPWGDWHGKTIGTHALSRLLRPFGIRTMSVRTRRGANVRGYKREQFGDAFARVLSVTTVTERHAEASNGAVCNAGDACDTSTGGERAAA